jgi:predicted DNA-binding transcriptional regulator YafY
MSKLTCMLKIITLLQTNSIMSSNQLAEIMDTNVRNIKAYIQSIKMAGILVDGLSGPTGGGLNSSRPVRTRGLKLTPAS